MTTRIPSWLVLTTMALALAAVEARAERDATVQAFERFEEALAPHVEEGALSPRGIGPILLVSATPAFENTRAWFPTAAIASLTRVFGAGNLRVCEACMSPRVHVENGRMEHNSVLTIADIARLDAELRGQGAPAKTAVWLDETPNGLSVRLVSIENAAVLFAGNFDVAQRERVRTQNIYNATLELGRRLRGESLTHIFVDAAIVPNQHLSLDIAEQFGDNNQNLAGLTFSLIDPIVGVGVAYYRVIPAAWNLTIGVQGILSVPNSLILVLQQIAGTTGPTFLFEPLLTGVLVARLPIPNTSFAIVGMVSTNFRLSIGITLMNISFLPFIP